MEEAQPSQSQQPVNTTLPVVNSSNSKLIPIILGIAAVIAISIAAYLLGTSQSQPVVQNSVQPTPIPSPIDPTVNWKTYTNTKVGFEIKYPPRYTKPTVPASNSLMYADGNEDNITIVFGDESSDQITLSVIPFEDDANQLLKFTNSPNAKTSLVKNLKVDGHDAFGYLIKDENDLESYINILFIGKGHGFTLEPQNINYSKKEIDLMLSTFQFSP